MTKIRYTRVQRFCLHDGPGIRTTVFLFGCNLRCPWCCNPENLVESGALPVLEAEPGELAEELLRDRAYFGEGGGVTFSGGEPLLQAEALEPLLKALKGEGVNIAVETALLVGEEAIARVRPYVDLFIVDFKPELRIEGAVSPMPAVEAYGAFPEILRKLGGPYWLRTVYVDGATTDGFLDSLGAIASRVPPERVEVLPLHELGRSKLPSARPADDRATVYSFDVFDTLITRCVKQPVGVFRCVANAARAKGIACPRSFPQDRMAAEAAARRGPSREEVTLGEIYGHFGAGYDSGQLGELLALEERAEIDLCLPIARSVSKVNSLFDAGCRIVLVSDMYLSSEVVGEMLRRCGVRGYERLYLSSEVGLRKSTGHLFEYVVGDLDAEPEQLLHTGDDDVSDKRVPESMGINIDEAFRSRLARRNLISRARGRVERRSAGDIDYAAMISDGPYSLAYSTGYSVLGPLLYAFSNWLRSEAEADGVEKLFFVSRDGLIMKRAYEALFPDADTHYLYGSRRAMTVPRLHEASRLADALQLVGIDRGEITVSSLVTALGLDPRDVLGQIEACGLDLDDRVKTAHLAGEPRMADLYDAIRPVVLENSLDEDHAFASYIRQTFGDGGKIGFVDIGWSGSTQRAMAAKCSDLGIDLEIIGYYTGLRAAPGKSIDRTSRMKGFLFDFDSDPRTLGRQGIYNALYETFFGAQHGTVIRFEVEGGEAVPVLADYEHEGSAFADTIREIQSGALAFVGDARKHRLDIYIDFSPEALLQAFGRLGLNPTLEEADLFGAAPFLDYGISHLAEPPRLLDAITHPEELIRGLMNSYWKPAYLKRLLKFSLPYGRVVALGKDIHKCFCPFIRTARRDSCNTVQIGLEESTA